MGSNNQPGGRAHSFKISDLFIVIDELLTMKRLLVPRLILGLALLAGILQQETEEDPLPDYYARLKLSHTASMSMIKKSFRKLAMQFHPDKNKDAGAEVIFQELSEAYSVLGSEDKKAEYDELYREEYQADQHVHHADDFTDEELNEVNIDTVDDVGPTFEDLPRYGDPPPRHHYEDVPVEHSEETVEPLDDVQGGHYYKYVPVDRSEETVEPQDDQGGREKDVWGDLDDEALFKVLKFLADHDYEISKKTVFKEAQPDARAEGEQKARWKRSTDFNTYRHEQEHARMGNAWAHEPPHLKYSNQDYHYSDYNNQFTGQNYRYSGKGSEHSGHEHSDRRRYSGPQAYPKGHDRRYSGQQAHPTGHDRRFDRYSDDHYYTEEQYSRTGPSYCRTTVRWEGSVKLTQKLCH